MRSLKKISHRDWLTLRDIWLEHLPAIDLDNSYPEPTLWELPELVHGAMNPSGIADCTFVKGVREAVFRESVILSRKFIYCGSILPLLAKVGKNTWTAVAAYETSFYGAKALCYLLGFSNIGRSSDLYLDVFCESERRVGKKKEKHYDIWRVHKMEARLTHEMLWAITERLIDTTTFSEELRATHEQLRIFDWSQFSHFRNKIFYDGAFWPLHSDMRLCDLVTGMVRSDMTDAARLSIDSLSPPFAAEYFKISSLLKSLLAGMFRNLAELAPAIGSEVRAFEVLHLR